MHSLFDCVQFEFDLNLNIILCHELDSYSHGLNAFIEFHCFFSPLFASARCIRSSLVLLLKLIII